MNFLGRNVVKIITSQNWKFVMPPYMTWTMVGWAFIFSKRGSNRGGQIVIWLAVYCYRRNKSPTNLLVVPHRAMPRSSSAPDVRGVKGPFLLRWEVKGHGQWAVTRVVMCVQCPSFLSRVDSSHLHVLLVPLCTYSGTLILRPMWLTETCHTHATNRNEFTVVSLTFLCTMLVFVDPLLHIVFTTWPRFFCKENVIMLQYFVISFPP